MKIAPSLFAVAFMGLAPVLGGNAVFAASNGCPPGLVKKDPPCVPPGQAKKGVTTDQWLNRDRRGDVISREDLIYLDDFMRYDLPPLPAGQRYAVVDDRIVIIDQDTYTILQLIRAFTDLAN